MTRSVWVCVLYLQQRNWPFNVTSRGRVWWAELTPSVLLLRINITPDHLVTADLSSLALSAGAPFGVTVDLKSTVRSINVRGQNSLLNSLQAITLKYSKLTHTTFTVFWNGFCIFCPKFCVVSSIYWLLAFKISRAEILMTKNIVENNLPIAVAYMPTSAL